MASNRSANPFASDTDLNPFVEQLSRPRVTPAVGGPQPQSVSIPVEPQATRVPVAQPAAPVAPQPAPSAQPQSGRMEFYNQPSSGTQQYAATPYQPPPSTSAPATHQQQPTAEHPPQPDNLVPPARDLETNKCWTMKFYEQFFDVSTKDVLTRMGNTLLPLTPPDFLLLRHWHYNRPLEAVQQGGSGGSEQQQVERKPDMYGPFWVCTTLWMILAIVSNMMSKISYSHAEASRHEEGGTLAPMDPWAYDFTQALIACATVYAYCFGMSAIVWGLMKWKDVPVTLLDTLCLYGYSMFIFLLTAVLCAIPISTFQWLVCIVGGLWSTTYLLVNFWHVWRMSLEPVWFFSVVCVVFIFHMGITLSFKFYFTNYKM